MVRLRWEYGLPVHAEEKETGHNNAGPLLVAQGVVHFVTSAYRYPLEVRADDASRQGEIIELHRVDLNRGSGEVTTVEVDDALGSPDWNFISAGPHLLLHTGYFHAIQGAHLSPLAWPYVEVEQGVGVNQRSAFLRWGGDLIFAGATGGAAVLPDSFENLQPGPEGYVILNLHRGEDTVYCYDVATLTPRWALALDSPPPRDQYHTSAPKLLGGRVVCFGRGALNWVDPATGHITDQLRLPRVEKLFPPLMDGPDLLLPYTNWTTGGVLRYSPAARKVLWKYRRRQYVAEAQGELLRCGGLVVWVKAGTEIVALDPATGEQVWSAMGYPWYYTGLDVVGGGLIFGTAGRDDAVICRLNGQTGAVEWRHCIAGGCSSLAYYGDSVLVGDDRGVIRRIHARSGKLLDQGQFGGSALLGDMLVHEDALLVPLGWDEQTPRLVCIDLE